LHSLRELFVAKLRLLASALSPLVAQCCHGHVGSGPASRSSLARLRYKAENAFKAWAFALGARGKLHRATHRQVIAAIMMIAPQEPFLVSQATLAQLRIAFNIPPKAHEGLVGIAFGVCLV
jgi:hypothetical protein